MRHRLEQSKMRDPHILVGNNNKHDKNKNLFNIMNKRFSTKHIFPIPEFDYYQKLCLPLAVIIGYHYEVMLHVSFAKKEGLPIEETYKISAAFYHKIKILKKNPKEPAALNILRQKWISIYADIGLSPNGPFDMKECINVMGEYFGANIYVIDSLNFAFYYKHPQTNSYKKPSIFLLLSPDRGHIDLILDRFKAFPSIGSPCLFCNKITKYYPKHRCYNKMMCFVCNRYKIDLKEKDDTTDENFPFITVKSKNYFCIKKNSDTCHTCEVCNLYYRSKDCYKKHRSVGQCNLKKKCLNCKKVYMKKYEHLCEKKFCLRCKTNYDNAKAHFCVMLPQPKVEETCALAVYDCETIQDKHFNSCYGCFYREKDYLKDAKKTRAQLSDKEKASLLCDDHKGCDMELKSFHSINMITVYVESEKMGHFSRIEFSDSELEHPFDMCLIPDDIIIPKNEYYLEDQHGSAINRKKKKSRRKRNSGSSSNHFPTLISKPDDNKKIYIGKDFAEEDFEYIKKKFSAVEKFLIFFLREQFRNTSFIGIYLIIIFIYLKYMLSFFPAHNGSRFDTILIASALFDCGISPNLITKGLKVF